MEEKMSRHMQMQDDALEGRMNKMHHSFVGMLNKQGRDMEAVMNDRLTQVWQKAQGAEIMAAKAHADKMQDDWKMGIKKMKEEQDEEEEEKKKEEERKDTEKKAED